MKFETITLPEESSAKEFNLDEYQFKYGDNHSSIYYGSLDSGVVDVQFEVIEALIDTAKNPVCSTCGEDLESAVDATYVWISCSSNYIHGCLLSPNYKHYFDERKERNIFWPQWLKDQPELLAATCVKHSKVMQELYQKQKANNNVN